MKQKLTELNSIRNTNLRLNMDNPVHQKAWSYLQGIDKKEYKSYSNLIAYAIIEYLEKHQKNQNQLLDEVLLTKIKQAVAEAFQEHLPDIITSSKNITNIEPPKKEPDQSKVQFITPEPEINDAALDFIEGFGEE